MYRSQEMVSGLEKGQESIIQKARKAGHARRKILSFLSLRTSLDGNTRVLIRGQEKGKCVTFPFLAVLYILLAFQILEML